MTENPLGWCWAIYCVCQREPIGLCRTNENAEEAMVAPCPLCGDAPVSVFRERVPEYL